MPLCHLHHAFLSPEIVEAPQFSGYRRFNRNLAHTACIKSYLRKAIISSHPFLSSITADEGYPNV